METSKGRRAAARERLYAEGAGDDAGDAGVKPTSTKKLSWLTKHVKSMGLGDEERDARAPPRRRASRALPRTTRWRRRRRRRSRARGSSERETSRRGGRRGESASRRGDVRARLAEAERRKETDSRWREMQAKRSALPACAMREEVLRCIDGGRASVVSGATGCGKTTQVPQFVFEEAIRDGRGGECSVIITQPRRLSAIAVAERVAAERCERVGDVVGYSIRLESRQSRDTRLFYSAPRASCFVGCRATRIWRG